MSNSNSDDDDHSNNNKTLNDNNNNNYKTTFFEKQDWLSKTEVYPANQALIRDKNMANIFPKMLLN